MRRIHISKMTVATGPSHKLFSIEANGIPLKVSCTLKEFHEEREKTVDKVNENFRNTLRYMKLYGDLPRGRISPKKLEVWTQTEMGIAVRGSKLPVPEFTPFPLG